GPRGFHRTEGVWASRPGRGRLPRAGARLRSGRKAFATYSRHPAAPSPTVRLRPFAVPDPMCERKTQSVVRLSATGGGGDSTRRRDSAESTESDGAAPSSG